MTSSLRISNGVRRIAVLGSTGSIGRSTLEVVAASSGRLQVVGLAAHSSVEKLDQQAQQFKPDWVVAADADAAANHHWSIPASTRQYTGGEHIARLVQEDSVDIVVAAIVGSAGLQSVLAALEAGKTIALANKETLVMAGPLVTQLAREQNAPILPVDSEHSAIFQALQGRVGGSEEVSRIILTASGGPFREYTRDQLRDVTVEQALAHPTWEMGPKITVDSATMMNKALEIIEARWLFNISPDKIVVVVHPQSIVHSMVEYCDGSVLAQLSPPDMKLPIQYALSYPERWPSTAAKLKIEERWQLEFSPPDMERFPALKLGYEAAERGGTTGAVLNAANETAVAEFLAGRLAFHQIVPSCRGVLDQHNFDPQPTLDELIDIDRWAREEVLRWISSL
ncbi:MAG TPA: 1-deoxy-D-xylulose-5-phosphate reductoisomerase [Planctomycetes bacterium]|jgi:1-deoxy-D-xylulose-5-phosphate reductoisomerase|nr:1-deoxy-D-xylulose-5-phosphate reductoisomerase [Planctomycetaceae bacterium]HIM30995.1 1-deoxy-D-xylulose-5-phosphate reductoisomerase [Planctomycetota bacterium]